MTPGPNWLLCTRYVEQEKWFEKILEKQNDQKEQNVTEQTTWSSFVFCLKRRRNVETRNECSRGGNAPRHFVLLMARSSNLDRAIRSSSLSIS